MKRVLFSVLPTRTGATSDLAFNALLQVALNAGAWGCGIITLPSQRTDIARHNVQKKFMEMTSADDDTLVFVDEDHTHSPTIIEQLAKDDKSVVSSLSFRRGAPFTPTIYFRDTNGILQPIRRYEKGLIQVAATGFPAVAIQRRVFVELEKQGFTNYPHFCYTYPNGQFPSEDVFFSEVLERANIPIFCDTRIISPHISFGTIGEDSWEQYRGEHTASGGKVSVVIPAQTEHITRCVQSILDTAPTAEIVVLANLKTPSLPSGVKRILLTQSKPVAELINLGIKVCKGDIVMAVNDTAVFQPQWLESALSAFDSFDTGVGVVETNRGDGQPGFVLFSKKLWQGDLTQMVARARDGNQLAFAKASIVEVSNG